jgi:GT2 family glycosyltransferase
MTSEHHLPGQNTATAEPARKPTDLSSSVVVCVYTAERLPEIDECLRSLDRQTRRPDDIVVVVDHNAELGERLRSSHPHLTVVDNVFERGLSGARNTGVDAASGDVIAFLDDDAHADAGWLAAIVDAFADPAVVGVGGKIVPDWETRAPAWFPPEFLWVVGCSYRGLPTQRAEVRNPIGASMAFRRSAFDAAGRFDGRVGRNAGSTAPMGCEETEFSLRVRSALPRSAIVYEPDALAFHHVPASRGTWRYFLERCYAEGRSKRLVSASAPDTGSLDVERGYVTRTLRSAAARYGRQAIGPSWRSGLGRLAAMVVGVTCAVLGYARAMVEESRVGGGSSGDIERR